MRALITGITGFVGSHLAEHLLAAGDAVQGTAREAQGRETPAALASVELALWNVADDLSPAAHSQIAAFAPEVIFHLAAMSIGGECQANPPLAWNTNVRGSERVFLLAASLPQRPRVLFVSSAQVYGPVSFEQPVVAEDMPLRPQEVYARTKWAGEQLAHHAARHGVECVIVRSFNHAGPRQSRQLMLAEWAAALAETKDEPLRVQSLSAHLDLSDARDAVRAYRLLALEGTPGEAYNVGSGLSQTSGQLLAQLMQLAHDSRSVVETSPGRRQRPIASLEKLRATIKWRPEIPLETTLSETLAYWRSRLAK